MQARFSIRDCGTVLPLAALLLSGCARVLPEDGALTMVPYVLEPSGRILVDAHLDEQGPYRLALDTAASISLISGQVRDEIGVTALPDRSVLVHGLITSERLPLVRVGHVRIGDTSWRDAEIVPLPHETLATSSLDGVLGIDFLRRYALGFSSGEGVLRLYSPDLVSARTYRGWASIPLEPRHIGDSREPIYFLDIDIGDRTVSAIFDLGSGENIINSAAAKHLRVIPVSLDGYRVLSGPLAGAQVYTHFDSDQIATGGASWRDVTFLITDLEIFATLGYTDLPLAILGSGLFNRRDFIIDFARNRLLVRLTGR